MHRRRSPSDAPLGREDYYENWSTLHGSIDPSASRLVAPWLRLMFALGAPLVKRSISPSAVTVAGVVVAVTSLAASVPGTRWPLVAAVLILCSSVLDGVDGAVAVIGRSESRWGYVLDTVADRCSDLCFLGCAYLLGAPTPFLVATGALTLLQESARARASGAGLSDFGLLTVWERPSRVVTAVIITGGAGIAPTQVDAFAFMGGLVGLVLAALGFLQLMIALFRRLR